MFSFYDSASMDNVLSPETARQILEQAEVLERVTQILQEAQDALPPPDPDEVALLREGGCLSVAAYLIGLLQRVILSTENAASDLRASVDAETLAVLDQMRPSAVEINAIESALQERRAGVRVSHV